MSSRDSRSDDELDPIVAEFRRDKAREEGSYRARGLKLLPHVCGHCGREFEGKRLRELTVHHKDVDPTNNPPDGSNWELLCLYCHDEEHQTYLSKSEYNRTSSSGNQEPTLGHNPFEGLRGLLKPDEGEPESK